MKYFKNTELARIYKVSEKSVRNWIQAAEGSRLDLLLHYEKDKPYIANITKNTSIIEDLVQRGKKYKNTRGFKTITPSQEFYARFTPKQVLDIISNIDIYREIPYQYNYFNGGAVHWDLYTQKLFNEKSSNYLTDIIELLDVNIPYLDELTERYTRVNVIDIGTGNCLPVKQLLEYFWDKGKLGRYIGIDISHDMLDLARRNIDEWFEGKLSFEGFVKDINYERFDDLLVEDSFGVEASSTINIVLFLGSTIVNFREPDSSIRTIHASMGKNDLLLFSLKLDSERSRRYFDFTTAATTSITGFRGKNLLEILNIHESLYTLEQFFDEKHMTRRTQVRFTVDVSIEFQHDGRSRTITLNKGDTILLWRATHQNSLKTLQQFDVNGFEMLLAARSKDQESLLLVSRLKTPTE